MAGFSELVVKLELQQAAFQKGMDSAARSLAKVQTSAKSAAGSMTNLEAGMKGVAQAAAAVGTAFAAVKGFEAIVQAADKLRNLQGSFTALLGSASQASDMMARVFGIVQRTGAPLDAVSASTQRLIIAMGQLGASNAQIEKVAETFIQLGKVGGSSAAETASALQQLGQALASGKLGGDELKSIRENAPLVAEAIAQALGVTSGKLKELGEDGKLTSDVVANALIAASGKASEAFAKLPQGFEQSLNRMEAQATLFGAQLDTSIGVTNKFTATLQLIEDSLKRWTDELEKSNNKYSLMNLAAQALKLLIEASLVIFTDILFTVEAMARALAAAAVEAYRLITLDWSVVGDAWKDAEAQTARARAELDKYHASVLGLNATLAAGATSLGVGFGTGPASPQTAATQFKPLTAPGGAAGAGKGSANKDAEELKKRGEALAAAVDAQEAFNQKFREYDELLAKGAISQATFEKAVAKAREEMTASGDALKAQVDPWFAYEQQMKKVNEAYRNGSIEIEHWLALQEEAQAKLDEATKKPKTELEKLEEAAIDTISGGVGDFFKDMISGSMSAAEAFNKMVKSIISDLAKLLAEFAAKEAAKFIIKSIFGGAGGTASGSGTTFAAPASLMLASRPTTWNAAASLAGPSTRAGELPAGATTAGAAGGSSPWNVVINNNAPGVDVSARPRNDGGLEVTVERVRSLLAQDVVRGGNNFSRSLESAYGLGRGR